jgi:replicative DNA helicase
MGVINKDSLGYLGLDFQYRLIQQLLVDRKFGESIVDILKPNYFEDSFLRTVSLKISDNYEEYGVIPDINNLESIIVSTVSNDIDKEMYIEQFSKIREAELNNGYQVQDTAMKFCKQQELKKSVREIERIIQEGNLDDYYKCEDILKKALEVGDNKDEGMNVFDNIESVLAEDFRNPIPTGINGLDSYMDGGLAKGELGVLLAAFGIGKTSFMTKVANNAKNIGKNVLQIFFEDMPRVIQKKHLACWMEGKYTLNELNDNAEEVMEVKRMREEQPGKLILKKFPSDSTTIPHIKQYIKKLISKGFKPDILLLDYIDCVQPSKSFDSEWSGEGNVMRQFESLLSEFDIAGWTAVQGNRSAINAEVVDSTMIGGSIKKGQIGHFILSVAKSLQQKDNGTANMAILKSRFGKDGIEFHDVTFNNGTIQIDMTEDTSKGKTFLESTEIKKTNEQQRVNQALESFRRLRDGDSQN